jgi:hypothetical protein
MLTTTLSKPQSMSLGLPDKNDKNVDIKVDENRTATLLLGDNNKLTFYMGLLKLHSWTKYLVYGEKECVKNY